jgi:hypothetical protein
VSQNKISHDERGGAAGAAESENPAKPKKIPRFRFSPCPSR